MRRSPALAIVCCAAFIVAVVWLMPPRAPTRPGAMQVVQRLEQPRGMAASASRDEATLAALSSRARHRWMASAIASSWTRVASGASVTLRSPRLGLSSPDDVYAIVVGVAASAGEEGALLLWGHEPTLSRADYLRWRRDIRAPRGGASTVVVRGKDIRGDGVEPLRYLFLHLPAGRDLSRIIDFVAIVETRDIGVGTAPAGAVRLALDGHVRDVLPGLHELSYPVDVPDGAELVFGVRPSPNTTSTVRVTIARRGSEALVLEQRVNGGAWRDFRTALPAGPAALLTLQTASPTEGEPPSWSVPLLLAPEPEHDPRRPNIVLYVVDTLRADTLGLYGAATASTPTLDDLGARGRVFRHAYTAASWTKPAIASLLTSLHPQTHGLGAHYYTDPLPDRVPTLQGMLQAEGYATAQFSGNAFAGTLSNLDRGFDWSFMPSSFGTRQGAPSPKIEGDALTARVLPWLEAHARDRFFLYVQSMDVHPPYTAAERAAGGGAPSARDQYTAAVSRADREIGRLYTRLAELGLASRTLFVVTADHGEAFGEHGAVGHGQSVYDEEARVPLVLHWPGRIAPGWVDEAVSLVDLMPTILDYASVAPDAAVARSLQGRSLAVPEVPAPHPVFVRQFVYPEDLDGVGGDRLERHAVVKAPWKLVAIEAPGGAAEPRFELFDLAADPAERDDRAAVEPQRVREMARTLSDFLRDQAQARARFVAAYGGTVRDGTAPGAPPHRPSADVLEQLRSLGYVR